MVLLRVTMNPDPTGLRYGEIKTILFNKNIYAHSSLSVCGHSHYVSPAGYHVAHALYKRWLAVWYHPPFNRSRLYRASPNSSLPNPTTLSYLEQQPHLFRTLFEYYLFSAQWIRTSDTSICYHIMI